MKINGAWLFYKETGRGPQTIVFSHGLLMDHSMFEPQRQALDREYRVIAYDHRGQGQSQNIGPLDMDTLAADAAALIVALKAAPCHFAGLSMGGFVGMRLAARWPELVRSLTLMNTGAEKERLPKKIRYGIDAQAVKLLGVGPFVGLALREMFGRSTRHDPGKKALIEDCSARLRSHPRSVGKAVMGVVTRKAVKQELSGIRCPTLVITGEEDTTQPVLFSERIAAAIPGAKLVRIPRCGHSSSLEQPEAVVQAMRELLAGAS